MNAGLSIDLILTVHVAISLVAIAAGLLAMGELAAGRWRAGPQIVFLLTTLLTSVTGFLFPFTGVTPAFLFGVLSVVGLTVAIVSLPRRSTSRAARIAYAVSATFALYLNLFVLVVQSFQKLPQLQPLAPTQTELPFIVAQLVLLALAVILGLLSSRKPGLGSAPR